MTPVTTVNAENKSKKLQIKKMHTALHTAYQINVCGYTLFMNFAQRPAILRLNNSKLN